MRRGNALALIFFDAAWHQVNEMMRLLHRGVETLSFSAVSLAQTWKN